MNIVSWNVNGIRACYQKDLKQKIESLKPDIFCVQETKADIASLSQEIQNCYGNHSYFCSSTVKKGYSGVATFSLQKPKSVTFGLGIEKFDQEGRVLITEFEDFKLYNIYFPNGGMGEERVAYKEQFNDSLFEHLAKQLDLGHSLVVVGDYNIAHTEMDIFDPQRHANESGFLPKEREWFSEFLELGFVDTFRETYPEAEGAFTWWSYRERARPLNRGWRIDYICVSSDLQDRVMHAQIHSEIEGSDHCPVSVRIE